MTVDIVDLREFYATPLGMSVEASLRRAFDSAVELSPDAIIIGLGYPVCLINRLEEEGAKPMMLMPARQGALQWPSGGPYRTALVDEEELPLSNASVDLVVMVHLLENVADPAAVLQEVWRVLAPEGRVFVVATNRRGLWARFEHTPFGVGRPFSRQQLGRMLREAKLIPLKWSDALHFPPMRSRRMVPLHGLLRRLGRWLWPVFSGVIVVEATKRLYQGLPVTERKEQGAFVPALAPQSPAIRNSRLRTQQERPRRTAQHPKSF